MLCLVYQFRAKKGFEEEFRSGWHEVTSELVKKHGSLGARLHLATDGSWISYAQWPDRETWQKAELLLHHFLATTNFKECLDGDVKLLVEMEMMDDLLVESEVTA